MGNSHHREFMHTFKEDLVTGDDRFTDGSHGFPKFGYLKDVFGSDDATQWGGLVSDVLLKVTIIAKAPQYFDSGIGNLSIRGRACTWAISKTEIDPLVPRERIWTRPFSLADVNDIVVLFWPFGETDQDPTIGLEALCSVYIVFPHAGCFTFELGIGSKRAVLTHEFDGLPGLGWGWCRGYGNFCKLSEV